ncbi:hypothetical protein [Streptomyces sp. Ncost-T10-10d]|uniref:hypothetical protein n=1 Tax=Streptomyces sp. Ncost-T10-10d TaxID=1839774 RepID=UPI00081D5262|nr:hypothetical protein [Streptomyces sp. Ncost-T10-10d]SCF77316.1 hypothetical protein GA0115254_116629 [Streptomyces sp. Ncost-T10-10d]
MTNPPGLSRSIRSAKTSTSRTRRGPALTAVLLAALLSACGSPAAPSGSAAPSGPAVPVDGGSPADSGLRDGTASSPPDRTVSGLRDDIRHITRKTATGTRPRTVERCTTRVRKVKHTSSTGSTRKTRTWYTNDSYKDCEKVQQGTRSYTRVVRPARWCVELDNVGGNPAEDDVWYEVESAVYHKATQIEEGSKLSFTPLRRGC